jgi:phosphonatase-like hydrolase
MNTASPPTIDLVVFDMAGTTVRDDDAVHHCLRAALTEVGVGVTRDEVNEVMGLPKPVAIALLLERRKYAGNAAPPVEVAAIYDDFLRRMIAFYRTDPAVREIDGASSVFRQLRRAGLKLALDTGFSRAIVDAILQRLGWMGTALLDATVASDEVPRGRPHPDLVFRAMERTGVTDARRVAKVGDTPSDLHEGRAAGCGLVIGVTNGSHTRAQLAPHPHTHLIDDLRELPGLLLGSESGKTKFNHG